MSIASENILDLTDLPSVPVRRFTVEQYHEMGRAGILTETDKVELIDGWIIPKMNRNPRHDNTISLLQDWLFQVLPTGWRCRVQCALTTELSEPEPDLSVVRGGLRQWMTHHPMQSDVGLLIEVADSSLRFDRGQKLIAYARASIAQYWIVNLIDGQIEIYLEPTGPNEHPKFRQRRIVKRGEMIQLILDDQSIAEIVVDELLP